jgi:hypothetical protein
MEPSELAELQPIFAEVFDYVQSDIEKDAEMLYVVGLGAHLFGYLLPGGERVWDARAERFRRLYRDLSGGVLNPDIFKNRGYFGDYYLDAARVKDGY